MRKRRVPEGTDGRDVLFDHAPPVSDGDDVEFAGVSAEVVDLRKWAKKKARGKTIPNARFAKAVDEATKRQRTGEWGDAPALVFVALYSNLHEGIYGCSPAELGPTERLRAAGMARRMLDQEFDFDPAAMAEFMRWAWKREHSREQWRRETGNAGARIGWVIQFGGRLLTDYRVDLARAKARR